MIYNFLIKNPQVMVLNLCINSLKMNFINQLLEDIWGANLADMQLISKYNKGIRVLFCIIDPFNKCSWTASLKDKKGVTIVNAFQVISGSPKRKHIQ